MIMIAIFVVSAAVVVLSVVGYVPWIVSLLAIGIVFAVMLGYLMRRNSGPTPPPR